MRLEAARLLLAPVLLTQGRNVRRTIPRLSEPPGERQGVEGTGPLLRVLILGDSAAAGVGARHQDEALLGRVRARCAERWRVEWRLIGCTGATTASTVRLVEGLEPFSTDVVVTSLGVNDVTGGVSRRRFLHGQRRLVALLRERLGASLVILSGVPPMGRFVTLPQPLRWYLGARATHLDRALRALAEGERGCVHLPQHEMAAAGPMAPDGFHPAAALYDSWASRVVRIVAEHATRGLEG
jgi:lysophospholipase L1-like esterase